MRRMISWVLTAALILGLCACGQKAGASWQEQYDLGVKYLSEGNYEEAIIAFTAAIDIDPKRPEAYGKAAEAYVGLGDLEAAAGILAQGYEATGDSGLAQQLAQLEAGSGGQSGEIAYQPVGADAVSGTLSLSDVESGYEEGGPHAEYNEGAIGGMNLRFTVTGPAEVRAVRVWTWSQSGIQEDEIPQLVAEAEEIWKSDGGDEDPGEEVPFEFTAGFPVWETDRNTSVQVLLVGVDADGNAAGYTVVTVAIP